MMIMGCCGVGFAKQKDDLERQIENVKTYIILKQIAQNKRIKSFTGSIAECFAGKEKFIVRISIG